MYDLIIIGSGSMGAAGAYAASRSGLKVLMIDAHHPPHREGAHHGETRLFRSLYHNHAYQRLLNHADALWTDIENRHSVKLLQRCGVLNLSPADSADAHAKRRMAEHYGLPYAWLRAADIRSRWPGIHVPEAYIGLYEPHAGYLYSETAVALFIAQAERQGAKRAFGHAALRIARDGEALSVLTADGRTHRARRLAVSAGTWANRIEGLGAPLAFTPVRKTFAWYDAPNIYHDTQGFPGFTVETAHGQYYGFPDHGAGLKVGRHDGGETMHTPEDRHVYGHVASDRADTDAFLRAFLPHVGAWRRGQVCSYDRSFGEDFLIHLAPHDPAILLLGGFSGHGFKFAPAIGQWMAQFASGAPLPADARAFATA